MRKTALVIVVMASIIIGLSSCQISILPVCGEKDLWASEVNEFSSRYATVIANYHQETSLPINSIENDTLCDQLIALYPEDSEQTTCLIESVSENTAFAVISLNKGCRLSGEYAQYKYYFFGIINSGEIYPILDVESYSNTPEEHGIQFFDLPLSEYEKVSAYVESLDNPGDLNFLWGQYLYYWGKNNNISCLDMDISGGVLDYCLLNGIEDLYPDYDSYESLVIKAMERYKTCEDITRANEESGAREETMSACAMVDAEINNNPKYCFSSYLAYDYLSSETSIPEERLECLERSNTVISESYCSDLEEEGLGFGIVVDCYNAIDWQNLD